MKDTVVLGIGNILLKDDGVGVHIIRALENEKLPSTIELVDGGTSTLDTLGYFLEYKKVVVIDCLKAGYDPGTIYKIKPEEIKSYKSENLSIHDIQILDVVKMANMLGKFPEVIIFGIEPEKICLDTEMTETMKNKISEVIKILKLELYIKEKQENAG
ncbi:hydrogenase maturation protease [Clostridium pasteurianum DSM 525 = ATCC 6013]|uniref:Hydrogenase maturation protease n=1 Tax=Clostridium pasteurianum DSM 525 = ATCC 6013 TaxID=1262449 RepID=A0A0H3J4G2_CLOPA|nr:HyaD/HybD family hydrogenase maturation endopeptidase [Clostridium pasteurianum]AJA46808.1 hydrogenase maturation protease [Clostridium pasteurianum DSM 525 = ATCC 6013]AJA50796.1 hydrogenase maturation protease [Clostridium pasteurianum DSM 525 = ATCC 6013]AOZ74202.1 hydrogenase maturation protease [Clostridium pasteurianum DSM 525 = ATCC 6013]AOZ78000.1 hydrogenase maturation protease [Clostridium pasteurianum]ELP58581.1 protein HyaD1 [Clostridium pasteurianum DSM 525 = ATCC 6013]